MIKQTHKQKQKLIWISAALFGFALVVALVLYALNEQANYYYDPIDIQSGQVTPNKAIRAGGLVVSGSVHRDKDNPVLVKFSITDNKATVPVVYEGILPDLFKENSGVIVDGTLQDKVIIATKVLAKHDENYMPPEVEKSLNKAIP